LQTVRVSRLVIVEQSLQPFSWVKEAKLWQNAHPHSPDAAVNAKRVIKQKTKAKTNFILTKTEN